MLSVASENAWQKVRLCRILHNTGALPKRSNMDPDRWRRIEYLYHEALAREDGERSSFLAQVCGSDEELRREVESLLRQGVTHFLEQGAVELTARAMAEDASQLARRVSKSLDLPRIRTYSHASMDPHIRYARTPDGTSLAYWRIGEGPTLVITATYPWSHLELEWDIAEARRFCERLAEHHTVIRYDGRGVGLSEKAITDFSLDVLVADLSAIVDHLRLESFDLLGIITAGPIAIKYASLNPNRVRHLVLWSTYARPSDYTDGTQVQATRSLIDQDWELYTETVSNTLLGWSAGDAARRYAAFIRASATPESARAFTEASRQFDVSEACQRIGCPALVMHRSQSTWLDMESSKYLAGMIPNARLRNLEGESVLPFVGNIDMVVGEIVAFTQGSTASPLEDFHHQEGETLSHYRLVKQIGEGGMGELYLAHDLKLDRTVALKLLSPAIGANRDHLHRFIQEAKAASRLNHPNVCIVHEIGGIESGRPFIAMEFLDGETIARRIARGALKVSETLDIGAQVLSGLGEAHAQGIVHRDIKPQNIMVSDRGIAKILDFGLARIAEARAEPDGSSVKATMPGTIAGTVQYMSPEQSLGRRVDHRTDIFSFGLTIYEMATGRPTFTGATPLELMENVRHQHPQSITAINSFIPGEFERIVMKCLEKDPGRRYQSTAEIAGDWNALRVKTLEPRPVKPVNRWAAVTLGLAILGIAAIAIQFFHFNKTQSPTPHTLKMLVLPFTNMSGDSENEYLSDGITEELISALTKVQNMRVVARTSAFALKGKNMDVRQLGKMLDVDKVVEGSVQKEGNRLRVSAQLVNTSDGYPVWSNTYDRNIQDVFAIEDDISGAIAHSLSGVLTSKTSTTNIEAYQQYFEARYLWNKRTPNDLMKAIEHFRRTTALDPNYAPAYVGIADSLTLLASYEFGIMKPVEAIPQARTAAMKALAIDERLPEAHVSLATILYQFEWNWEGAEKEFKRAVDLNPSYATGRQWYGEFLSARGRFDESLREIESAEVLDPLSLIIHTAHGRVLYLSRNYDLAIQKYQQAISLEPNFLLAHAGLGFAYAQKSMYDAALAEFHKAIDISGRAPVLLGSLGFAEGLSGHRAEALKLLQELKETSNRAYVMPVYEAAVHLGLDDRDQAITAIEQAYLQKSDFITFLGVEPAVDKLRSDPRFKNLLSRANIQK